jgi:hypothetical protein
MRSLTLEIEDAKLSLKEKQASFTLLSMKTLPELFAENNIPSITIGPEGNAPGMTMESKPFYKAVLPEDSEPGLKWLKANGAGDLIKRVFTIPLPMDSDKAANELRKALKKMNIRYEEKETVPWMTLTAFVKELIEKRKKGVPLEILGAIIGRVVKVKSERAK